MKRDSGTWFEFNGLNVSISRINGKPVICDGYAIAESMHSPFAVYVPLDKVPF